MSVHDITYLNLLWDLVDRAEKVATRPDRTGTGTVSIFGPQLEFNLKHGFPLLTIKKTHVKSIIHELLWFLNGDTNIKYLNDNGVTIWDEWSNIMGNLGPIYGFQWRKWPTKFGGNVDQIENLMYELRHNPYSRRHIVSGWNPTYLPNPAITPQANVTAGKMALPPCHTLWQVFVDDVTEEVSLKLYQRSADYFLGVPFNIASYAFLTHMIANILDRPVGKLIMSFGDCHLYSNHIDQAKELLERKPKDSPALELLSKPANLWDYKYDDFAIINYNPHPVIKAPISV